MLSNTPKTVSNGDVYFRGFLFNVFKVTLNGRIKSWINNNFMNVLSVGFADLLLRWKQLLSNNVMGP